MTKKKDSAKQNPVVIILFIIGISFTIFAGIRFLVSTYNSEQLDIPTQNVSSEEIRKRQEEYRKRRQEKAELVPIASTQFDKSETGSGELILFQMPDNSYTLWLENYKVSEGPELHVIALPYKTVPDNTTIATGEYIDLGILEETSGDKEYKLPDEFDPDIYKTIAIWCTVCDKTFLSGSFK